MSNAVIASTSHFAVGRPINVYLEIDVDTSGSWCADVGAGCATGSLLSWATVTLPGGNYILINISGSLMFDSRSTWHQHLFSLSGAPGGFGTGAIASRWTSFLQYAAFSDELISCWGWSPGPSEQ
ncbi:MAG: hypothetical protein IPG74_02075 [Flavobacteriales bacterium]|nr:hypothetical protein [Flavobacteriales bacterium]